MNLKFGRFFDTYYQVHQIDDQNPHIQWSEPLFDWMKIPGVELFPDLEMPWVQEARQEFHYKCARTLYEYANQSGTNKRDMLIKLALEHNPNLLSSVE